jgi:hypothetical protein
MAKADGLPPAGLRWIQRCLVQDRDRLCCREDVAIPGSCQGSAPGAAQTEGGAAMAATSCERPAPAGKRWVYTKTIRLKSGRVLHAESYGLRCFAFLVNA